MIDVNMVRFLLSKGADPNWEYSDCMFPRFCCNQHPANSSLDCGILMGLCAPEYNEVARVIIDSGADLNQKSRDHYTTIYMAVKLGNYDLVAYLADHKADVNVVCRGDKNWTPLHRAICNRNGRIARFLLERGANLEVRDIDGRRPIDLIDVYGDCGMKELLEEKMRTR